MQFRCVTAYEHLSLKVHVAATDSSGLSRSSDSRPGKLENSSDRIILPGGCPPLIPDLGSRYQRLEHKPGGFYGCCDRVSSQLCSGVCAVSRPCSIGQFESFSGRASQYCPIACSVRFASDRQYFSIQLLANALPLSHQSIYEWSNARNQTPLFCCK